MKLLLVLMLTLQAWTPAPHVAVQVGPTVPKTSDKHVKQLALLMACEKEEED